MTDYVKIYDYAAKDALLTGNPAKLVKGTELGAEFDAVAVAVASKVDEVGGTSTNQTLTTPNAATIGPDSNSQHTLPDVAADTITLNAASQTLTNKTITAPAINGTITTTGLTLPALTLAGAVTGGGQNVSGLGALGCGAITATTGASADTNPSLIAVGAAASQGSVALGAVGYRIAGGSAYNGVDIVVNGATNFSVKPTSLTTGSGITSLAFQAGNPSLNIGTGALTAGSGTIGNASGQNTVFDLHIGTADVTTGDNSGLVVVSNPTGKGWLGFNDANNASIPGQVTYNHSTDAMEIVAGGSTIGTFSSTGLAVTGAVTLPAVPNIAIDATSTAASCVFKVKGSTGDQWQFGSGILAAGDWGVYNTTDSRTDLLISGAGAITMPGGGGLAVTGALSCTGALSKGSGSFRVDHPLKPETHQLVHSFIEGPQADLIYRGKVTLVNGTAQINIDTSAGMTEGTFVALCRDVQVFTTNESGWNHVRGSVSGNTLTIECKDATAADLISWMVLGERKDQHMYETDWTDENGKVIVEPLKPVVEITA